MVTPLVALVMVGAGTVSSDNLSDTVAVALIVVGSGMFFIGMLAPSLGKFEIGPTKIVGVFRDRDQKISETLGPVGKDLARTATWLAGSPGDGEKLVEKLLTEMYRRWPQAERENPAEAAWRRLIESAPPPGQASLTSPQSPEGGRAGDLLTAVAALPPEMRSAIVLHLLDGMSVDAVASVTRREPEAVAADIERAAGELVAATGPAPEEVS